MKLSRNFKAPVPEAAARERVAAFFKLSGYELVGGDNRLLRFRRGSIIGTYSNFNPSSWAAEALANVTPSANQSGISIEFRITVDPFETRFASELAEAELNLLEDAVIKNEPAVLDFADLRKRIAANVYHTVGILAGILISVFLGALGGVSLYSAADISPALSAASGVGIFIVLVIMCLTIFGRQRSR